MNKKIYINREDELTEKRLLKILRYHRESILPEFITNRGYYEGTGQQIMRREYPDPNKPSNRIVKNYCKTIVENYRGYIAGVPITYDATDSTKDISELLECLRLNDYQNSDSE